MRPIIRGGIPTINGKTMCFTDYREAFEDLKERIGLYCSYCGMHITNAPAIEHMCPKSTDPSRELDWNNFLLACIYCNSVKGKHPDNKTDFLEDYLWPDENDTFNPFVYMRDGIIRVNLSISEEQQKKARKTLELTGLNRLDRKDHTVVIRRDIWGEAETALYWLKQQDTKITRELIIKLAKSEGYWSVWVTVFSQEKEIIKRLIEEVPGTNKECFCHVFE